MRICRNDIHLVKPGDQLPEAGKRKKQTKTRKGLRYEEMNAAQRRKVDRIRLKAAEVNQDGRLFQGAEIRSY